MKSWSKLKISRVNVITQTIYLYFWFIYSFNYSSLNNSLNIWKMSRNKTLKHITHYSSIPNSKSTIKYSSEMLTYPHTHIYIKSTLKKQLTKNYPILSYFTDSQEVQWATSVPFMASHNISTSMHLTTLEMDFHLDPLMISTETNKKFSTCMWTQSNSGDNKQG